MAKLNSIFRTQSKTLRLSGRGRLGRLGRPATRSTGHGGRGHRKSIGKHRKSILTYLDPRSDLKVGIGNAQPETRMNWSGMVTYSLVWSGMVGYSLGVGNVRVFVSAFCILL